MKRWLQLGLGVISLLLVIVAAVLFFLQRAAQHVPEFYAAALQADPAARRIAGQRMTKAAAALASDVQREGPWQAVFSEEEINGWLAVELVEKHADLVAAAVSDPRVKIEPDNLTLAFRYRDGRRSVVVSLSVDAYLVEPNVVALRIRKARAGSLPLPLEKILREVSRSTDQLEWRIDWRQAGGDPVAQITIPPLGARKNRQAQIQTLRLERGRILLSGATKRS